MFRYEVANSRVVPLDIDINMHKSSRTFFTDADISRTTLLTKLLSPALARIGPVRLVLAAVQCNFKQPIGLWQAYRVSSRILAWDDRPLYVTTYFTKSGALTFPADPDLRKGATAVLKDEMVSKAVFATLVMRYVLKAGRKTVSSVAVLLDAGLLIGSDGGDNVSALGITEVREVVEGLSTLETAW
ncbi:hypothetical protein LZ32DRAFT_692352 [Colletotrichum eremochloae]|nr:hypothetical protein LZ32DRAFT_692352 [Colletotrichum eremochloae]